MIALIILLCALTGTLCFLVSYAMHYQRGYLDGYHEAEVDHGHIPDARLTWIRYPSTPSEAPHEP